MVFAAKQAAKKPAVKKPAANKVGRPSTFTQALADTICELIASGKSQRSICDMPGMPSHSVVDRWIAQSAEFQAQYARAREQRADKMAEEILEIADDGKNDTYETEDGTRTNQDVIARSKLRVDARKWLASKMSPKKYGDKVETTLKGDADAPIKLDLNVTPDDAYLRMIGK